jgi:hypothetical protein
MEWSGRAPAPPVSDSGKGTKDKEHAMSQKLDTTIAVIGIDIGKNSFHVVGLDRAPAYGWRMVFKPCTLHTQRS